MNVHLMRWRTVVTLSGLLAWGAVQAADPAAGIPDRGPVPFDVYDSDGDGRVSAEEFHYVQGLRIGQHSAEGRPMRNLPNAATFEEFDGDGDGFIDPDEMAAGQQARMNTRGGGRMGAGGAPGMGPGARPMPEFGDFDLDGDGAITEEEFYRGRGDRMSERAQQGYPLRGVAGAPPFGELDRDGDGRLTPDEFAAAQQQHQRMPPSRPQ